MLAASKKKVYKYPVKKYDVAMLSREAMTLYQRERRKKLQREKPSLDEILKRLAILEEKISKKDEAVNE